MFETWPDWAASRVCTGKGSAVPAQFPAAYLRFLPSVRAKCRRLLGSTNDAEEAAHEAFVRLWESGPVLAEDTDTRVVMAWLYRTSTRIAIDLLRRRRRDAIGEPREDVPCGVMLEASVSAKRVVASLHARVPSEELEAAVLCRVDGLSHPEAAEVLGVSERTVRRLLERFDVHAARYKEELSS